MVELRIKKAETHPKILAIRGVDRAACEQLGGTIVNVGNEAVCFVEETKLKDSKILKKVDVEVVDVGEGRREVSEY